MFFFGDRKGHEGMIDPRDLAQLGGKSATLIDKEITENGSYNAKDDGADGYANVDVNIISFNEIQTFVPQYNSSTNSYNLNFVRLLYNKTGDYVINGDSSDDEWILTTPVKSLYLKGIANFVITFTPATGFDTSGVPYKIYIPGTGNVEGVASFIGEEIIVGTRVPYCGEFKKVNDI